MKTTPELCLGHSIRRADRVMSQIYNDFMAPLGLKITQFSVLRALHYLGSTTAKEIQNTLVMEQATVSRALKPLIRDGYILTNEGTDKRERLLSLSKSGQALYNQALTPWNEAQQRVREALGSAHTRQLLDLRERIVSIKH